MRSYVVALATLIANLLFSGATLSTVTGGDGVVYFHVIVSSSPATLNTSGVVSAVDRALELINNDPTILPRHHLRQSLLDTQVCSTDRLVSGVVYGCQRLPRHGTCVPRTYPVCYDTNGAIKAL